MFVRWIRASVSGFHMNVAEYTHVLLYILKSTLILRYSIKYYVNFITELL